MYFVRLVAPAIVTVSMCLITSRSAIAWPIQVADNESPGYVTPPTRPCDPRISRIERMLEKIAKKVGVELEPVHTGIELHNTRLITRADGVTVLDESCLWPDPSSAVLELIKRAEACRKLPQTSLSNLKSVESSCWGRCSKRSTSCAADAKIEQIKQRSCAR